MRVPCLLACGVRQFLRVRAEEEVGKGTWWMPRLLQAMKDVISCDKPR